MHELSVCQALLEQVTEVARANNATSVKSVTVRLGPLAGVEPQLLAQAFGIARLESVASRARLIIETEAVIVHCSNCDRDNAVTQNRLRCPVCHRPCPDLVSGDALTLASIDIERPDLPLNSGARHV